MAEKQETQKKEPVDLEKAVEEYLGIHPKYFIYTGMQITVDIWSLEHDGKSFNGFLPHLKELGQI